jgi:GR25 family glycosyltransferase involved in LPS biosynthesis
MHIVPPVDHYIGAKSLWLTILEIVGRQKYNSNEYVLICEDDHQFTDNYSKNTLFKCIEEAKEKGADILLGGVSSVHSLFKVSDKLVWIEGYTGNQFLIIFRKFFQAILAADFNDNDAADCKLSSLASNQFLIFPFISIQKEFGYSDVTFRNNEEGRVTQLFTESSKTIEYLLAGEIFYKHTLHKPTVSSVVKEYSDLVIPTYVINLAERTDRLKHIQEQFRDRTEFDVTYIDACFHEIGALGLWNSVREIIRLGIDNDDDVLAIVEDDHIFTEHYSRELLIRNIIEAHSQGVDILSGGINNGFSHANVVSKNRFWINHFHGTQFVIIYRKLFKKILDEPFDFLVTTDDILSKLTSNKMVFFPFISQQNYFGYSDVSRGWVYASQDQFAPGFLNATCRLSKISEAYYTLHSAESLQ